MKWKLKRWGGVLFIKGDQARVVVADYTQKKAVARLNLLQRNVSLHFFRGYFSETGNQLELMAANRPGVWLTKFNGEDRIMKELKT